VCFDTRHYSSPSSPKKTTAVAGWTSGCAEQIDFTEGTGDTRRRVLRHDTLCIPAPRKKVNVRWGHCLKQRKHIGAAITPGWGTLRCRGQTSCSSFVGRMPRIAMREVGRRRFESARVRDGTFPPRPRREAHCPLKSGRLEMTLSGGREPCLGSAGTRAAGPPGAGRGPLGTRARWATVASCGHSGS
jgi:hypothetical protein